MRSYLNRPQAIVTCDPRRVALVFPARCGRMSRFLRNHARFFLFTTLRHANNGFHNQVTEPHTAPYTRPYMEASGIDRAATLVHQRGASLGADAHRRGHGEALTRLEGQLLLLNSALDAQSLFTRSSVNKQSSCFSRKQPHRFAMGCP